jgi:Methyltransferase domain
MPRTQQEFDQFLSQAGGDPWHYTSRMIVERLDRSLAFVREHLGRDYAGRIVEAGAFNGDFTRLVAGVFPRARILATDISEVALEQLRARVAGLDRVTTQRLDLVELPRVDLGGPPDALLLMECLYYLEPAERQSVVRELAASLPRTHVFISGPVTGGRYFTVGGLRGMFEAEGYRLIDRRVVSLRYGRHTAPWFWLARHTGPLGERLHNQVIFYFRR